MNDQTSEVRVTTRAPAEETLTTNLVAFLAIQYIKEQTAKYSKNATFILKSYYYQKITKPCPKLKSIEKKCMNLMSKLRIKAEY